MNAIRIRTLLSSDTLHLPELKPLIGKPVEIIVREEPPARAEFYAELANTPETEEAFAAQQTTFRRWRADPQFAAYWPTLDHLLARDFASAHDQATRWAASSQTVRRLEDYDFDAQRIQDECDIRDAEERLR